MTIENPREAALEASKEGTFSFLDRALGRNYPTDEVVVYLDEAAAYRRNKLAEKIMEETYLLKGDDPAKAKQRGKSITILQNKLDEMDKEISESRVTFHLEGIPSEKYDEIVDLSIEQFPLEYIESRNPITMKLEREPKPNEDRETLFRTHLWSAFVRKITDESGAVDENHSPEYMGRIMGVMPIVGAAHVQRAIENLRMTTDWMDQIQGDDFFQKP